jgi:hypothetical protein
MTETYYTLFKLAPVIFTITLFIASLACLLLKVWYTVLETEKYALATSWPWSLSLWFHL